MRQFIAEHPEEGRRLNNYIRRQEVKEKDVDKPYVKRTMGQYQLVTPDQVQQKMEAKLAEPIIREQIETAKRVYREAREVLTSLHTRKDAASGSVVQSDPNPEPRYRRDRVE